ncbi:alpha-L-glutamate ligase-like protein [Marinimicrobium alkaliphilum]|uniref:alpha-L-glutamate ligase-like protein n=1 Tax=Marinimicrobium alkaliphilum TaxID=2202654 RepID=UPI0018E095B0
MGILGMNCRNREFIGRYNERERYPLVDDKLKTKLLAEDYGLAMPALRFVVSQQHEIGHIERKLYDFDGFVLKPAKGSGGKGILVITGRHGDKFVKASGAEIGIEDIRRHMTNTLAGLYSLSGQPDVVIVEDLIEFDDSFEGYSHEGVPDIRIVVFQGYPVMAMLRLATHASDGKANLHQGAVGVGLDIGSGRCLHAVQFAQKIKRHPDTDKPLNEIRIGDWRQLMILAARCYDMTGLGYIGTDIVLDKSRGPQLLELNARPGLSIQVANGEGLLPRLRHIEAMIRTHWKILPGYHKPLSNRPPHADAEDRVDYVIRTFGRHQ